MKDAVRQFAPESDEPLLLSTSAVSRLVGIGRRTLWRWISAGQFPDADVKIGTKVRRWRRGTVIHWIEQRTRVVEQ